VTFRQTPTRPQANSVGIVLERGLVTAIDAYLAERNASRPFVPKPVDTILHSASWAKQALESRTGSCAHQVDSSGELSSGTGQTGPLRRAHWSSNNLVEAFAPRRSEATPEVRGHDMPARRGDRWV
jgi:hypothetical protein